MEEDDMVVAMMKCSVAKRKVVPLVSTINHCHDCQMCSSETGLGIVVAVAKVVLCSSEAGLRIAVAVAKVAMCSSEAGLGIAIAVAKLSFD
jgi:hypothetical protein